MREFTRISNLGAWAEERIVTVVQDREAYLRGSDAAEWSAASTTGAAHEIVHACLANLPGTWPWLHEGLAQKLSRETLAPLPSSKTCLKAGPV